MRSGRLSLEPNSSESGREIAKGSQDVAFGGLQTYSHTLDTDHVEHAMKPHASLSAQ